MLLLLLQPLCERGCVHSHQAAVSVAHQQHTPQPQQPAQAQGEQGLRLNGVGVGGCVLLLLLLLPAAPPALLLLLLCCLLLLLVMRRQQRLLLLAAAAAVGP
jgi:hypothetical protein